MKSPQSTSINIKEICKDFSDLILTTEIEVLGMGNNLQTIQSFSRRTSTSASDFIQIFTEGTINSTIEDFQDLLGRIDRYLDYNNRQILKTIENLRKLSQTIAMINPYILRFKKHVKDLKRYAISIRIETARLGDRGQLLETLSIEIDNLAEASQSRVTEVLKKIKGLISIIDECFLLLGSTREKEFQQSQSVIEGLQGCLSMVSQLQESCSHSASDISLHSQSISSEVSGIVTAIQFHDITRQQIEHVVEVLQGISLEICKSEQNETCDSVNGGQAISKGNAHLLKLQAIQLNTAMKNITDATETLLQNLSEVAIQANKMYLAVASFASYTSDKSDSYIEVIQSNIQLVVDSFLTLNENHKELSNMLSPVAGELHAVQLAISEIANIDDEIDLLAKNGIIKAAHLGSDGAALGVLVQEVVKLSHRANKDMHELDIHIGEMKEMSLILNVDDSQQETNVSIVDIIQEIIDDLNLKATSLKSILESGQGELKVLEDQSGSLQSLIDDIVINVNMHHAYAQVLGPVIEIFDKISINDSEYDDGDVLLNKKNIENITSMYTMQGERDNHERLLVSGSEGKRKTVETDAVVAEGDDSLDDNIELF
ncbi:methyl-accepting chemotaxis protein [bacterium]|nr:methyl-accepting chemotaxis protein [bacterium]